MNVVGKRLIEFPLITLNDCAKSCPGKKLKFNKLELLCRTRVKVDRLSYELNRAGRKGLEKLTDKIDKMKRGYNGEHKIASFPFQDVQML